MTRATKTLADLKLGESATIDHLTNEPVSLKLMEMGCIPGVEIQYTGSAPFGDPIKIMVDNEYILSLRKAEAKNIWLKED